MVVTCTCVRMYVHIRTYVCTHVWTYCSKLKWFQSTFMIAHALLNIRLHTQSDQPTLLMAHALVQASQISTIQTVMASQASLSSRVTKMFSPQDGTHGVLNPRMEPPHITAFGTLQNCVPVRSELSSSCTTVLNWPARTWLPAYVLAWVSSPSVAAHIEPVSGCPPIFFGVSIEPVSGPQCVVNCLLRWVHTLTAQISAD